MSKWLVRGLRSGIKTTRYPGRKEEAAGVSPGLPCLTDDMGRDIPPAPSPCPTGALRFELGRAVLDYRRCIHCFRCVNGPSGLAGWNEGYEWASLMITDGVPARGMEKPFGRSLHIRFVDGGACGACLSEIEQINKPYYNMHRLGFFVTPTPRDADVLMVAGPVTDHLRLAIRKTYEAMPAPKRVLAIGACALSGGIFGPSFACPSGLSELVPVDVGVPGCPPPPLAIIHALLVAVSRKPSVSLTYQSVSDRRETP